MDFIDIAARVVLKGDEEEFGYEEYEGTIEFSEEEQDGPRLIVQNIAQFAENVHRAQLTEDEQIASVIAISEMKHVVELSAPTGDTEEKKQGFVSHLVGSIFRWVERKIEKTIFRFIFRAIFKLVKWLVKRIVVGGIRLMMEWLIRPILTEAIGFLVLNPEISIPLAIAGGLVGLGYYLYKKFFGESSGGEVTSTQTDADKASTIVKPTVATPKVQPTTELQHVTQLRSAGQLTQAITPTVVTPVPTAGTPQLSPSLADGDDSDTKKLVIRHEGIRNAPYKDSRGLWTIGVGHLIGNGRSLPDEWNRRFSMEEIMKLFDSDFEFHKQAAMRIPNFGALNKEGKEALIDLTFNMGPGWWKKWTYFTAAMQNLDIAAAVESLKDSQWFKQVGARAREVISLLSTNIKQVAGRLVDSISGGSVSLTPATSRDHYQEGKVKAQQAKMSAGAAQASRQPYTAYLPGPNGTLIGIR